MKITLEDEYGIYTIETKKDIATWMEVQKELMIPVLKGAGFVFPDEEFYSHEILPK